ncbi:MAG: hypothetical protein CMQ20_08420 [Gammaproteobacteria bacterium]|jgi:hypothetical protein|nr:hypothetical protein [Gammaproteobacteria bacterium]|tara:strand:+ start:1575 stop:2099 length:525 start_codon:yes stop_codon:yes gene_type:complete
MLSISILLCAAVHGEPKAFHEYDVKAAFLLNLPEFVTWSEEASPSQQFNLCILEDNPFGVRLRNLEGQPVKGRPLQVKSMKQDDDLLGCSLIFISQRTSARFSTITKSLPLSGALTVGESRAFVKAGGVIGLVVRENKVHLEVSIRAAEKAGLSVAGDLLELATVVEASGEVSR